MNKLIKKELEDFIVENSLAQLENKSILITGASGLIASYLIEVIMFNNLVNNASTTVYAGVRNIERAMIRFSNYIGNPYFNLVQYDVINNIEFDFSCDYLVHAASNATPAAFSIDPIGTIKANVHGTLNLLEYSKKANVQNFLYISSSEVYGNSLDQHVIYNENSVGLVNQMDPRSCYTESKRMAENICVNYNKQFGVKTCIARVGFAYGPTFTSNDNRVIPQFVRNAMNNENIVLKSTGEVTRSYAYLYDVVSGLLTILFKGKAAEAYNVANRNSDVSIKEIAETVANIANVRVIFDLPKDQKDIGYAPFKTTLLDASKLESLGWKPKFDLYQGLSNTLEIYSDNSN